MRKVRHIELVAPMSLATEPSPVYSLGLIYDPVPGPRQSGSLSDADNYCPGEVTLATVFGTDCFIQLSRCIHSTALSSH